MRELDVSTATRVGTVRLPTHRGYVGTIHIFFELYFTIDFGLCDRAFRGVHSGVETLSKGRRDQPDDRAGS